MAFMLSRMAPPEFPTPMGIIRRVDRPAYNDALKDQLDVAKKKAGLSSINDMLHAGETWTVEAQ